MDGKLWRENKKENFFVRYLVGGRGGKKNWWDPSVFSPNPPKYFLSKIERKISERNLFVNDKNSLHMGLSNLLPSFSFDKNVKLTL